MADNQSAKAAVSHAFGPWADAGALWAETLSELGSEVLHFTAERIRQDVETQHRLLGARSLGEVHHIQAEFVQSAIDQYTAETGRIVELSGALARKLGLPADI